MRTRHLLFLIFLSFFIKIFPKIEEKIVICGVCKNVASRLPQTIKIIEHIGNLFTDYRVLVYENNSTDNTVSILTRWSHNNRRVKIITENVSHQVLQNEIINISEEYKSFFIPELIARARNIVLNKAMSSQYVKYPYIIWIDMDFIIPPTYKGIVEVFRSQKKWDAVVAYGIAPNGCFWDWFALRDKIEPLGPELLGNDWYVPKQRSFSSTDEWYPVYSAFGGCGIYKKSSIIGCTYSAVVTSSLEKINQQIIAQEKENNHPIIMKYLADLKKISRYQYIESPQPKLPKIMDSSVGILLQKTPNSLIWKMNSFTYQYPAVCEHVTFHASMIIQGHGKIFINPRMVFTYGDRPFIRQ